jgi:hypothetical protein
MIPVLAVTHLEAARDMLTNCFGFQPLPASRLSLGRQEILLVQATHAPPGMLALPLDHVALRVPDLDGIHAHLEGRRGRLAAGYTPDGPRVIPQFGRGGVRYVFFDGPEGAPIEFCTHRSGNGPQIKHDHYGLRAANLDDLEAHLLRLGARRVARHRLSSGTQTIEVRFLQLCEVMFELFDEPPILSGNGPGRWIGLLPAA